jgi:hypothetical protein
MLMYFYFYSRIKDDRSLLRDPTEEEMRIYCRPKSLKGSKKSISSASSYTSNSSTNSKLSVNRPFTKIRKEKEKGIVIKVKNTNSNGTNGINGTEERKDHNSNSQDN